MSSRTYVVTRSRSRFVDVTITEDGSVWVTIGKESASAGRERIVFHVENAMVAVYTEEEQITAEPVASDLDLLERALTIFGRPVTID